MSLFKPKRIFLDYASATPLRKEVLQAMKTFEATSFYNPSAIYQEATLARSAVENSRKEISQILHAGAKDVIFTSGGTESDNLAIFGVIESLKKKVPHPHIIALATDHPAILEAVARAKDRGAEVTLIETSPDASVTAESVEIALQENTVLVTMSLVNGEVGTIQPSGRIGRILREHRKKRAAAYPYLHIDASQAPLTVAINVDTLGADLLTLDAGKLYGPKGVGALVVRPGVELCAQLVGGGQERGLRSGTENVSGIVGFAKALLLVTYEREEEATRTKALRDICVQLLSEIPHLKINGSTEHQAPHILSVTIPGTLHEFIAIKLDQKGIMVSTGSSCSTRKNEEDKEALRFSFGKHTTEKEVRTAIRILKEILL